MLMMSLAGAGPLAMTLLGAQVEASTLGGYDRAKVADANYRALHGDRAFPLEETDPEYAAMMKKYIYGDIAQQVRITPVERALVTIVVLTVNQNERLLANALVAESGRGYYQIWGEEPHEPLPGMTVTISGGVKHWHGAVPGMMFQHISVMKSVEGITTE